MESDVLHTVSPYQKRAPAGAPSKIVMSRKNIQFLNSGEKKKRKFTPWS